MTTNPMTEKQLAEARDAALARLSALRRARQQLDKDEVAAVAHAKGLGLTWRAMAVPFGSTFQYMQRRFGPLLKVNVTVEPAGDVPTDFRHARRRPRS